MAKVKLFTRYASDRLIAHPGETIDVSKDEAKELIAGGFAETADSSSKKAEDISDGSQEDSSADSKLDHARGGKKAPKPAA